MSYDGPQTHIVSIAKWKSHWLHKIVRAGSEHYLPVETLGCEYLFWSQVWIVFSFCSLCHLTYLIFCPTDFLVLKLFRYKFGSFQPSFKTVGAKGKPSDCVWKTVGLQALKAVWFHPEIQKAVQKLLFLLSASSCLLTEEGETENTYRKCQPKWRSPNGFIYTNTSFQYLRYKILFLKVH